MLARDGKGEESNLNQVSQTFLHVHPSLQEN